MPKTKKTSIKLFGLDRMTFILILGALIVGFFLGAQYMNSSSIGQINNNETIDMTNWKTYSSEDNEISFKYPVKFVKDIIKDNTGRVRIITTGTDEITNEQYDLTIVELIPIDDFSQEFFAMDQQEPQPGDELRAITFEGKKITPMFSSTADGSPGGFGGLKIYTYQLTPSLYAQINSSASGSGTFCADGGLGHTIESCKEDPQCVVMDSCNNFVSQMMSERKTKPDQIETALQIIESIELTN